MLGPGLLQHAQGCSLDVSDVASHTCYLQKHQAPINKTSCKEQTAPVQSSDQMQPRATAVILERLQAVLPVWLRDVATAALHSSSAFICTYLPPSLLAHAHVMLEVCLCADRNISGSSCKKVADASHLVGFVSKLALLCFQSLHKRYRKHSVCKQTTVSELLLWWWCRGSGLVDAGAQ